MYLCKIMVIHSCMLALMDIKAVYIILTVFIGLLLVQGASERAALIQPGLPSDGQFYSPPESAAGN